MTTSIDISPTGAAGMVENPPKATLLYGEPCLEALRKRPAGSIQCCVTSPPYWGLRDYGVDGQLGAEATPEEYVASMVDVFREVGRVLRDDGTLWLNLGDSYCSTDKWGGGGTSGKHTVAGDGTVPSWAGRRKREPYGLKPKDLVGIPWRVALALQADGWYLRSDIIWHKPNPMPESVTDRPTKSHEYMFLLTKSARYFYDADAIREPSVSESDSGNGYARPEQLSRDGRGSPAPWTVEGSGGRRNKRSVWTIATKPYSGAHFAVFPPKLVEPCILAGTSARGCCSACGAPWVRVVESSGKNSAHERIEADPVPGLSAGSSADRVRRLDGKNYQHVRRTTGEWQPGCECDAALTPCTVLDPFSGSATTGLVALSLGRDYVGVDLNEDYLELARARLLGEKVPDPEMADVDDESLVEQLFG